jgi:hypothetical protein
MFSHKVSKLSYKATKLSYKITKQESYGLKDTNFQNLVTMSQSWLQSYKSQSLVTSYKALLQSHIAELQSYKLQG